MATEVQAPIWPRRTGEMTAGNVIAILKEAQDSGDLKTSLDCHFFLRLRFEKVLETQGFRKAPLSVLNGIFNQKYFTCSDQELRLMLTAWLKEHDTFLDRIHCALLMLKAQGRLQQVGLSEERLETGSDGFPKWQIDQRQVYPKGEGPQWEKIMNLKFEPPLSARENEPLGGNVNEAAGEEAPVVVETPNGILRPLTVTKRGIHEVRGESQLSKPEGETESSAGTLVKKQKKQMTMGRKANNDNDEENIQDLADMKAFRDVLKKSSRIVILTGAGVSAESGIPTFRGAGSYWRKETQNLATLKAFKKNSSLVWEFYHHRREVALSKYPNPAHVAIAEFEDRMTKEGKQVTVITQNVDELHRRAGTKNLIELHGSLFTTKCLKCKEEVKNYDSPICSALKDKGAPDEGTDDARIPEADLPRCKSCNGLLRPGVVWFYENLNPDVLKAAEEEVAKCDVCLVVGTSAIVYPAAGFVPDCAKRGIPVAEFNLEPTPFTTAVTYHFQGPCGSTLPDILRPFDDDGAQ